MNSSASSHELSLLKHMKRFPIFCWFFREHPALRWKVLNVRQHRDVQEDA